MNHPQHVAAPPVSGYYGSVRSEIEPLLPAAIDSVLEIGCGAGATMRWLRDRSPVRHAAGVELFPAAAEQAREVFDVVATGPVDSIDLRQFGRAFDLVLALDVLEHLPQPDDTLRRLATVMRPGGLVVASLPNVANYSVS